MFVLFKFRKKFNSLFNFFPRKVKLVDFHYSIRYLTMNYIRFSTQKSGIFRAFGGRVDAQSGLHERLQKIKPLNDSGLEQFTYFKKSGKSIL